MNETLTLEQVAAFGSDRMLATYKTLRAQLAEAQANVRALAEVLQTHKTHNHGCLTCECRRDKALARPGVVVLLGSEGLGTVNAKKE